MKVNPNLFPRNPISARSAGEASEARRAFEAMLSAGASRTRAAQAPVPVADAVLSTAIRQANRIETKEPDADFTPLSRPGRVLDIKV